MSNAMRFGKRSLAGVAAAALALGTLSIAGATSASAKPSIKPKLTATATVSPVRYVGTLTSVNAVPAAYISWPKSAAPSLGRGAYTLKLIGTNAGAGTGQLVPVSANGNTTQDDSILTNTVTTKAMAAATIGANTDDSFIRILAGGSGFYEGQLYNGEDTVSWSFTTSGAVATVEAAPATQTALVGGTATVGVTIKDAAGNPTQLASSAETIAIAVSGAGGSPDNSSLTPTQFGSSATLGAGTFPVKVSSLATGTSVLTATGQGSLVGKNATASIVASGTVSGVTVANMAVTCATGCWNQTTTSKVGPWNAQIKSGTFTTVNVAIDDTTLNTAASPIRFEVSTGAGTVSSGDQVTAAGGDPMYVTVTPSGGKATLALNLGGGAGFSGNAGIVVQQVNVANAALGATSKLTIVPVVPTSQLDITTVPGTATVAKIGDPTTIAVTVDDSFGERVSGQFVGAYLGSGTPTAATLLSSMSSSATGTGTLTVRCATCTTNGSKQTFGFSSNGTSLFGTLEVTYTTTGEITSLSVSGGNSTVLSPTSVTNTTTAIAAAPLVTVPFGGSASTVSTQSFVPSTGANASTGAAGQVAEFVVNPSTPTSVTVSVPTGSTGIFVSDTPTTAWNKGETSVSVNNSESVYVFGTKAGVHNITFTAGGKTVTIPVKVQSTPAAAYNIAISPATQTLRSGAFGTATVTVTDVFGNPVGATSDDTGGVTVTATGAVRLAGLQSSVKVNTTAAGTAEVSLIADNAAGTGSLAATPTNATASSNAPAYRPGYTPPTGAPAPVLSGAATVIVGAAPADKSITITGSRTTIDGKNGIRIEGVVTGIENGKTVIPYFRFPGETTFAQGSARPEISGGSFTWQRKTGKKFYAYVTSDDGAVKSNRVIIPAA